MNAVYFNDLTFGNDPEENVRLLNAFAPVWGEFSQKTRLIRFFASNKVRTELIQALESFPAEKEAISLSRRTTLRNFVFSSFHPTSDPIENERGVPEKIKEHFRNSSFRLFVENGAGSACPALAWAYVQGGIALGFPKDGFWRKLHYKIEETRATGASVTRSVLCLSVPEHLADSTIRRWLFAFGFSGDEPTGFSLADYNHKHFKLAGWASDVKTDSWISSTLDGEALFNPGLRHNSPAHISLVRKALSAAFQTGKYETDEIDGFVWDSGRTIGAANGKLTSKIVVYMTSQNELHIRPKE